MLSKRRLWTLFSIVLCVFIVDFVKKFYVSTLQESPENLPIIVFSDFFGIRAEISYAINQGAAWGIFSEFPELLVAFRLVLITCLLFYLLVFNTHASWQVPLTLIIAGALGNVVDYYLYGYVIDMIQMTFWGYCYPVFNIADSAIFSGAVWLIVLAFFEKPKQ